MEEDVNVDVDILADSLAEESALLPLLTHSQFNRLTSNDADSSSAIDQIQTADLVAPATLPPSNQTGAVIAKIEDIFESIADCILDEKKELTIQLRSRASRSPRNNQGVLLRSSNGRQKEVEVKYITFPSKSPQEARKFTALVRILQLAHEALVSGIVTTKRNMYYRDPNLFVSQNIVDKYVDDIAFTIGVNRDALNVVAAAKGLVAGPLAVIKKDKSRVDYSTELEGMLIPNMKEIERIRLDGVQWILVIEKEATFRTLSVSRYWLHSLAGRGVLITAKGYPDIQSRQFLCHLSLQFVSIPIYVLVDYDLDGIGIMSTYKYGSMNLAHETNLTVPSLQWLGIQSFDVLSQKQNSGGGEAFEKERDGGLLRLTARDRRLAMRMLQKESVFGSDGLETEWRREVHVMLMLNLKAEIQVLGSTDRLVAWLNTKLARIIQ